MSSFYVRFFKILVLVIGVCFSADCACLVRNAFDELERGGRIASYSWQPIRNTNIIILNTNGEIAATIFTLRYEHAGKIGAYFNGPNGRIGNWPFEDDLYAKEWIIKKAKDYGVTLAQ